MKNKPDQGPQSRDTAEDPAAADDLKSSFRAALERKKRASHRAEEHRDSHGAGPASNDKAQRQFRRKSG